MTDDITDLARRVERLEKLAAAPREPDPTDTGDALWILNGIKRRVDAPGAVYYAGAVEVAAGPVEWQVGLPTDALLEADWTLIAPSLAALASPVRLGLLHAIMAGASTIAELSADENLGTTGQLYHHLNQLTANGWLTAAGRGRWSIPGERVVPLLVILAAARRTA